MKKADTKPSLAAARQNGAFFSKKERAGFFGSAGRDRFFSGNEKSGYTQTKLQVGKPNDHFEKEADHTADLVVQRMHERAVIADPVQGSKKKGPAISPIVQKKCAECEKEEQLKKKEEEEQQPEGRLQKKPIFESNARGEEEGSVQRKCSHCEEEQVVQASGVQGAPVPSASTEQSLRSSKGSGRALPSATKGALESSFGADFSGVRIHDDSAAVQMSRDLNAQAFTHGNDIFFNAGRYDTTSAAGKHLLAHELTHTVQQGASQTVSRKPDVQLNQTGGAGTPEKPKEDVVIKNGTKIEFHLKHFPLKVYNKFAAKENIDGIEAPKYKRETDQKGKWKENTGKFVEDFLNGMAKKDNLQNEKLLSFTLKRNKTTKIIGSLAEIKNEIAVPFWDLGGTPVIHQVEHGIDWQILGIKADDIDNLILLDRKSNQHLGNSVYLSIQARLNALIEYYKTEIPELNNIKPYKVKFNPDCKVIFDNFSFEKVTVSGSLIAAGNVMGRNTPYKEEFFDLSKAEIPDGHFLLKTNLDRTGYLLPITAKEVRVGGFMMTAVFDKANADILHLHLDPIIDDTKKETLTKQKDFEVDCTKENGIKGLYFSDSKKMASKLRDFIGVHKMSPVEITESGVKEGFSLYAYGKVITDIDFLKRNNIDIDFKLEGTEYEIAAELSEIISFPKPFQVNACSVRVAANSRSGLSLSGNIAFVLGKLGVGEVTASMKQDGFMLEGKFDFNNKYFKPAQINFSYKKSKWTIGGEIGIETTAVPGLKSATLKVTYGDDLFSILGKAELSVPGVKQVQLGAEFDEHGNSTFLAEATLENLPGVKSGNARVTLKLKEGEEGFKLRAEGTAIPDVPAITGLTSTLTFLYDNGEFDMRAKVGYKKGRFDGTIEVGITNKAVDEKGQPLPGQAEENAPVVVFGFGQLTVELFKGIKGTVMVRLTPEKEVMIAGEILVQNLSPFGDGYHFNKKLIDFPRITIPLFGLPGLSISAFVDGSVNFKFDWQPLILKELKVNFKETNINQLEQVQLDIHGSVGSTASAEVYMAIDAGLEARVLVATLSGSLGGEAGLGISAEAGGAIDAGWDMNKGLQLKEIRAFLDVTPKALFRLKGKISVDLDLWITTVNLYYKEWVLAEKQLDMGGLTLKVDFPIKFDEEGNMIPPDPEKMNLQKPDFSGDQGKNILDDAINGDAKKELEAKKQQIKTKISNDLRNSGNKQDFSLSKYTADMKAKYKNTPELQDFVVQTIEDESRAIEYEQFEKQKQQLRSANIPLEAKYNLLNFFSMWHQFITGPDLQAFRFELKKIEEDRITAQSLLTPPATPAVTTPAPAPQPAPVQRMVTDAQQAKKEMPPVIQRSSQQPVIQLTPGDKHDLTSDALAGNVKLEACFDNELIIGKQNNSKGDHVTRLQNALISLGIPLPLFGADGSYGNETAGAVKTFQLQAGMSVKEQDGIVGRKTIGLMDRSLRNGKIDKDTDVPEDDFIVKNEKTKQEDKECEGKPGNEPCPDPHTALVENAGKAVAIIDKVLTTQLPPKNDGKTDYPDLFRRIFMFNFPGTIDKKAAEVRVNYELTKAFILQMVADRSFVKCGTKCDPICRKDAFGYHRRDRNTGRSFITFCPSFGTKPTRDVAGVIHESHHAGVPNSRDHAYEFTRLFELLDHSKALLNASSYHVYAMWVDKPGSEKVGPDKKDRNFIKDLKQKANINQALAFMHQWFELIPFDVSRAMTGAEEANKKGKYKDERAAEIIEDSISPWFNITRPPLAPSKKDIKKLQAIEERLDTMDTAFGKRFNIFESADESLWSRGPGSIILANQNLLSMDMQRMVIALLQELVHATPDISADIESLYVGTINNLRNDRSMDP
jgi:hypothetical protein